MISSQKKRIALGTENLGRGSHRYPRPLTPPKEKIAPPAGGLRLEREREREREKLSARGEKRRFEGFRGAGRGVLGQKVFFTTIFEHKPLFGWKFWVPRGRAEPPPFLLAKLMKRLP